MFQNRYLHSHIKDDLKNKIVMIAGPRQIGKTTLANKIGENDYRVSTYLNWDYREDRQAVLNYKFPSESKLLIFDEIHKYKQWRNYIKGLFDKKGDIFDILITGSARMDLYRRGGDSLLGRYYYYRLHPFSVKELIGGQPKIKLFKKLNFENNAKSAKVLKNLFKFGGFPEPLFSENETTLRKWHNQRIERLIKEDIRDIETLRDLSSIQILVDLLSTKVASGLSVNSLKEDLNVAYKTVKLWLDVLEKFYYHFRISPFSSSKIKSLRKEQKLYLWDWSEVLDEGAKFENLMASHLLKFCHFLYDVMGYKAELSYLRDIDGREVDFLVTIDRKPWFAVEAKHSDIEPSKSLNYFADKLNIPFLYQVVLKSGIDISSKEVRVISADKFLTGLV